jgi:hypothetical protein
VGELGLEVLKREVDAETVGVLSEEASHRFQVFWPRGTDELKLAHLRQPTAFSLAPVNADRI